MGRHRREGNERSRIDQGTGLRFYIERSGDRRRVYKDPQARHPGEDIQDTADIRRRDQAQVRLPHRSLRVRRSSARRNSARS